MNDLELDLAHHKVNLFSRDHCVGKVVYWTPPGNAVAAIPLSVQKMVNIMADMSITAEMSVDGKLLSIGFTTGDHSQMEMPAAHRMFGIDEHSSALQTIEADEKGSPQYRYPFREIEVEGLNIENPDIVVGGRASDPDCNSHQVFMTLPGGAYECFGGADLRLGKSVLRRLHLFFAFGEKMLYVTAASN